MEKLFEAAFWLVLGIPFCSVISYSLHFDATRSPAARSRSRVLVFPCPIVAISAFEFFQFGLPPDTIRADLFFAIPAVVVSFGTPVRLLIRLHVR